MSIMLETLKYKRVGFPDFSLEKLRALEKAESPGT